MTGWQGNDGGQGNWNQPYGPDPHTNQYGTDPYANQQGADPYGGGYGQPDPYQQPDPYASNPYTQPYPQYQTGGFPAQGYGPPPPEPKRSKLPMILSLIAIVIIVGVVVAIVIVNRGDTQTTADPSPETTTSAPDSPSTEKTSPSERPSSDRPSPGDDWIAVDNNKDAGLSYQVPPDWKTSSTPRASGLEVDFTGNADYGQYDCEGDNYVRTFAASGDVQSPDAKDLDLAKTVTDFAKSFAVTYYGADAEVDVPTPEQVKVDGREALKLTVKVKPKVTKPACQATEGEVALVGILLEADGKPADVTMLVVVNDLSGGPGDPKPVAASVSQDILDTVKVN